MTDKNVNANNDANDANEPTSANASSRASTIGKTNKTVVDMATMTDFAGTRVYPRMADATAMPAFESRLDLDIQNTFIDRWEGMAQTEGMWGAVANERVVSAGLTDANTRESVATFFLRRKPREVAVELVLTQMFKPKETAYNKEDVLAAIDKTAPGMERRARDVIAELTLPFLIKVGLVSDNTRYARHTTYGFDRVESNDLRHDVIMQNLTHVAQGVKADALTFATERISRVVFGEKLAEVMYPFGLVLLEMADLIGVYDDIIAGVAANIDPTGALGRDPAGVPASWRKHTVVRDLACNLVFVREALRLPKAPLRVKSDMYKLERFAPGILGWLKTSERYGLVSKAQILRNYESVVVRDVSGKPRSVIVHRRVETQPIVQNVFVLDAQIAGTEAYEINMSNDRLQDEIQSAYGPRNIGCATIAATFADTAADLVEHGWTPDLPSFVIDAEGQGCSLEDIAVLRAGKLHVEFTSEGIVSSPSNTGDDASARGWNPKWWYAGPTTERNITLRHGRHLGDSVITCDPVEFLLTQPDLADAEMLPWRPQGLGPKAFDAYVTGIDSTQLISVDDKMKFSLHAYNTVIRGAIRAADFEALKGIKYTCIVRPSFNSAVLRGMDGSLEALNALAAAFSSNDKAHWDAQKGVGIAVSSAMFDRVARTALQCAAQLSQGFREAVHRVIVEKAISSNNLTGADVIRFRARIGNRTFGALADLVALRFFMFIQGVEAPFLDKLMASSELARVCANMKSDREPLKY